ncbi:MAG: SPFH domain-containing protein [Oscillospiraceae bacterium]|nr:SPFH domain-containing protein [Oscillospiraceae bacterium]
MGLISAALAAASSTLADQWKEFCYCEARPSNVLVTKGQKRVSGRSSNTKGSDNIISNGSVIAVADGQCMIIVEQGKVVEFCAEPGEFKWDASTEPSLFSGKLGTSIIETFKTMGKRFTFGGDTGKDQRVYYFNTKEIIGNKYGTPSPVPFRVVDESAGIDMDIGIRCFGEYSYRICDPILFYVNVCGNISSEYTRDLIEGQLKTELLTALQPAFAKISDQGIRYSSLVGHTTEISKALNEVLSTDWSEKRGIEIVSFGVSSVKANEDDEATIKEMQKEAAYMDPTRLAARLGNAQAEAMKNAANNPGGAAIGFMGMNMAQQSGGMNVNSLFQMGQQQAAAAPAADSWKCACGATATGKFCPECGAKKPEPKAAGAWTCPSCGASATGKFCPECGAKKPEDAEGWTCSCGAVNKGKFCAECGAKKPEGVPQYKCDKCGWEPEKGVKPPKFCPECGDPFDDGDIVG